MSSQTIIKTDDGKQYEVIGNEPFAQGSYGVLWTGKCNNESVAIKEIPKTIMKSDGTNKTAMFKTINNEVRMNTIANEINWNHTVPVLGFAQTSHSYFIIQRKIIGDDLLAVWDLKNKFHQHILQYSTKELVCSLLLDIGGVLRGFSERNISYQDAKLENVLYDHQFTEQTGILQLKLIDYGLSSKWEKDVDTFRFGGNPVAATALQWYGKKADKYWKTKIAPFKNAIDIQGLIMTAMDLYLSSTGKYHEQDAFMNSIHTNGLPPIAINAFKSQFLKVFGNEEWDVMFKKFLIDYYPAWCGLQFDYFAYYNADPFMYFDRKLHCNFTIYESLLDWQVFMDDAHHICK